MTLRESETVRGTAADQQDKVSVDMATKFDCVAVPKANAHYEIRRPARGMTPRESVKGENLLKWHCLWLPLETMI